MLSIFFSTAAAVALSLSLSVSFLFHPHSSHSCARSRFFLVFSLLSWMKSKRNEMKFILLWRIGAKNTLTPYSTEKCSSQLILTHERTETRRWRWRWRRWWRRFWAPKHKRYTIYPKIRSGKKKKKNGQQRTKLNYEIKMLYYVKRMQKHEWW